MEEDAQVLMSIAKTRSLHEIQNPEVRRFVEEPVARQYPDAFHRVLEIEQMGSISWSDVNPAYVMEQWLDAQSRLDAALDGCGSQAELEAAVTADEAGELRSDLVIWGLLDRSRPTAKIDESTFSYLDAAEKALLKRLEEEDNPEGACRRDGTTDLYAICKAMQGNLLRVRDDVMGGYELTRRSLLFLRPGANGYIAARVYSLFASAAIDLGQFGLARKRAEAAGDLYSRIGYLPGVAEMVNISADLQLLSGESARDQLAAFVDAHGDSYVLSQRLKKTTIINLCVVTLYFHKGISVDALISELRQYSLEPVEDLWLRHLTAMRDLHSHKSDRAAAGFHETASGFRLLGMMNQAFFIQLFEALSLYGCRRYESAKVKVRESALYFSESKLYGGRAAQEALQILAAIEHGKDWQWPAG